MRFKMEVKIYSKTICPFCSRAKNYMQRFGIPFEEINLDDDEARQKFYDEVGSGVRTVPQIFVDGVRLGGYDDLVKSDLTTKFKEKE